MDYLLIQEVKDLIVKQACELHDKYLEFHTSTQKTVPQYISTADNFVTVILDFFKSSQFVRDVVDIIIQVVADALGLNIFTYQDNNGCLEVLKICGGELHKDICMKFTHNNKHSIGNHYEPMVREVQNKEMKQSVEVKIENEEETSEEEEQKCQPIIHHEPSILHESSEEDEASMICEESIKMNNLLYGIFQLQHQMVQTMKMKMQAFLLKKNVHLI